MTTKRALLLGLANTQDVDLAMRLVDRLGTDITLAITPLRFPSAWVLAKQTGPVATAAWAVKHCDDPEVLSTIASSPDLRKAVRRALLDNQYLSVETKTRLTPKGPGEPWAKAQGTELLVTVNRLLDTPKSLQGVSSKDALMLMRRLINSQETSYIDRFLEGYAQIGERWMIEDMLSLHYLGPKENHADNSDVYSVSQYQLLDALALYAAPAPNRLPAVLETIESILDSTSPMAHLVDVDLLSIALPGAVPESWSDTRRNQSEWLTPAAIEMAFNDHAWRQVLNLATLSDVQVQTLIDQTAPALLGELPDLLWREDDYPRAEMLLRAVPDGVILEGPTRGFNHMVRAIFQAGSDELVDLLLAHCSDEQLFGLVTAEYDYEVDGSSNLPPVRFLAKIIDRLGDQLNSEHVISTLRTNSVSQEYRRPLDYACELLLRVPGAAYDLDGNDNSFFRDLDGYIFQCLSSTGLDIEMALNMFSSQPEASLAQMVTTLKALAASEQSVPTP